MAAKSGKAAASVARLSQNTKGKNQPKIITTATAPKPDGSGKVPATSTVTPGAKKAARVSNDEEGEAEDDEEYSEYESDESEEESESSEAPAEKRPKSASVTAAKPVPKPAPVSAGKPALKPTPVKSTPSTAKRAPVSTVKPIPSTAKAAPVATITPTRAVPLASSLRSPLQVSGGMLKDLATPSTPPPPTSPCITYNQVGGSSVSNVSLINNNNTADSSYASTLELAKLLTQVLALNLDKTAAELDKTAADLQARAEEQAEMRKDLNDLNARLDSLEESLYVAKKLLD